MRLSRFARRLAQIAAAALVVVVLLLATLPALLSIDPIRARVLDAVRLRTGQHVTFRSLGILLFPVRLSLQDVGLEGPGRSVTTDRADILFRVGDLIRGNLIPARVVLVRPRVRLASEPPPEPSPHQNPDEASPLTALLGLPDVEIDDGELVVDASGSDRTIAVRTLHVRSSHEDSGDIAWEGRADVQVGSWTEPVTLTGTLHATPPSLDLHARVEAGLQADISARLLLPGDSILVEDGVVVSPRGRLSANGRMDMRTKTFEARVVTRGFDLGHLTTRMLDGGTSGRLAADLALRGTLGQLKTWRAQGRLALSDIAVRAAGGATIERLTLNLTGDSGTLDARVIVAAQPLAVHGGIVRWRGEPSITVGVEAGAIDVTRLKDGVAAESDARGTDHPTAAPELPASAVTIVLKRLTYGRLVLSDASIRASVRDTVVRLHRFSADTERGHLDAEGEIDWGRAGTWRISWFATGIGVEPLAESLFASSGELSGWLSSSGGLSGTLREGAAALASTCDIEALIEHGRVRRLAGISQILALVNLPSTVVNHVDLASRGLPFDRLKIVASIRDRRVQVRRAFLDSPIIKASAVGSYDIAENRLASTVAVSPLGSYVSLLSKLPVFDTLLDGDRDTLARAIFEVKGSMLAPTVRFLPLNSLEGSVAGVASLAFDVLRNGVRLPKELLTLSHRPRQAADAGAIDHCSGALS